MLPVLIDVAGKCARAWGRPACWLGLSVRYSSLRSPALPPPPRAASRAPRRLETMGVISIPSVQWMLQPSQYRSCLEEYYADWAPDKLGGIDTALAKYEGKEKQLFGALHRKYGKKVNLAKCSDK